MGLPTLHIIPSLALCLTLQGFLLAQERPAVPVSTDDDLKKEERDAKYLMALQIKQAEEAAQGQSNARAQQERAAVALRKLYEGILERQNAETQGFTNPAGFGSAVDQANAFSVRSQGLMLPGAGTTANPSAANTTLAPVTQQTGQPMGSEMARALDALAMEDGPEVARKKGLGFMPMGTIAEVRLLTAVNTQIPGIVLGQLVYDLWDVDTRCVIVPRGSKFIGSASSMSSDTEARGKVAFHTIVDPGGRVIPIATPVLSANRIGITGIDGKVTYHWGKMLMGSVALAVLSSYAGGNSQGQYSQNANFQDMMRQNMSQQIGQAGQQLLQRFTRIQPDIYIEEGSITKVIFVTSLMAKPYRALASMPAPDSGGTR